VIISAYDAWLINVAMNLDILTLVVSIISAPIAVLLWTDRTKRKSAMVCSIVFAIVFIAHNLLPKPVVVEKWIIAKYSVPEVMNKFDSYEAFYNQLGLEIREVYDHNTKTEGK
jgi:hypothetical protein